MIITPPPPGGGGLPYKKRQGSSSEILKRSPKGGTKLMFCGCGLNVFTPMTYHFLHNMLPPVIFFSAQYP